MVAGRRVASWPSTWPTEARINPKTEIAEHRHAGNEQWHWASAGHRDDGQTHRTANAENPGWDVFPTHDQRALYSRALSGAILHRIVPNTDRKEYSVHYSDPRDRERFPWPMR